MQQPDPAGLGLARFFPAPSWRPLPVDKRPVFVDARRRQGSGEAGWMRGEGWAGNSIDPLPVFLQGLLIPLALPGACGFGSWLQGQMLRAPRTESETALLGAAMALPAFLIGVTVSIALNRHDERRALMLVEANAIGAACLRAQMRPASAAMERP